MRVFEDIDPIKEFLNELKNKRQSIGFVPTMGALHQGHLSLIDASKYENDLTVCSIYINPTQFNKVADIKNYPRVLDNDIELLQKSGCDVLFAPTDRVMYKDKALIKFNFGHLENVMEGKFRLGHFNGVGLIISKLLHILSPDKAYFGQKDLQQFLIIRQLVQDLAFDVNLRCLPVVREPNGLAMSSRNLRLKKVERDNAGIFYKALNLARNFLLKHDDVEKTMQEVHKLFEKFPSIQLEYFEIRDSESLMPVDNIENHKQVSLFIAGYVGEIRLIDNLYL
ncbi:pantoate--beta-alanine ligase [soil metagenome]